MTLQITQKPSLDQIEAEGDDPIATLRGLHRRLLAQKTQVFPISGYDNRLHVRYKVLDPDRKREILDEPGKTTEQRHAQLLAEACDEILYRYDDGRVDRFPQGKVTFRLEVGDSDATLADVMGWETASVYATVLEMFVGKPEVMNIHAISVDRWMRTLFDDVDGAVVGGLQVTQ